MPKKTYSFTAVPNSLILLLARTTLRAYDARLLNHLIFEIFYKNNGAACRIPILSISQNIGIERNEIRESLKRLIAKGLVNATKEGDRRGIYNFSFPKNYLKTTGGNHPHEDGGNHPHDNGGGHPHKDGGNHPHPYNTDSLRKSYKVPEGQNSSFKVSLLKDKINQTHLTEEQAASILQEIAKTRGRHITSEANIDELLELLNQDSFKKAKTPYAWLIGAARRLGQPFSETVNKVLGKIPKYDD